jgi:hypothetical protein
VGLAGASLAVYKNTRIVAIKDIVQQLIANMIKNITLGGRRREYFIKSKLMFVELDLSLGVCEYALLLRVGFYPNEDLDRIFA